jgi:hypothetical protein
MGNRISGSIRSYTLACSLIAGRAFADTPVAHFAASSCPVEAASRASADTPVAHFAASSCPVEAASRAFCSRPAQHAAGIDDFFLVNQADPSAVNLDFESRWFSPL